MDFLLFVLQSLIIFLGGGGKTATALHALTGTGAFAITFGLWLGARLFFERKLKWSDVRSNVFAVIFVVVVWIEFVLVCMIIG